MSTIEFNHNLSRFTDILRAFAYKLTQDMQESQDLYQETALRALRNKDKFQVGTNFKAWAMTIMKNIFINNYRKKMKANTIIDTTDNMYYINSGDAIISNKAESKILMEELGNMIHNLDETLRIPFEKHYLGFKYQEIAEELDLPLGTVKSRIFFARKELKHLIKKRYPQIFDRRIGQLN